MINMNELMMLPQPAFEAFVTKFLAKLTPREQQIYKERIYLQVEIGKRTKREAHLTTIESFCNYRDGMAALAQQNTRPWVKASQASFIPEAFATQMTQVVPEQDRIEIKHEEKKKEEVNE